MNGMWLCRDFSWSAIEIGQDQSEDVSLRQCQPPLWARCLRASPHVAFADAVVLYHSIRDHTRRATLSMFTVTLGRDLRHHG